MKTRGSTELFIPNEHAPLPTHEQLIDLGVRDLTKPVEQESGGDFQVFTQSYTMEDGWTYDTVSTVLPVNKRLTNISGHMTSGWFTGEKGFNQRRYELLTELGTEWTFVSVPTNIDRLWGDMEANARNQARIGRAAAIIFNRHPYLFLEDGFSRGAIVGESSMALSPEVGADVVFGFNTEPCQIHGVEAIKDIENFHEDPTLANMGRIATKVIHTAKKVFGGEAAPLRTMYDEAIQLIKDGELPDKVVGHLLRKFTPDSLGIPYEILKKYPSSGDISPRRLARQVLEGYSLMDGSYGKLLDKGLRPHQFQIITGFNGDELSRFEQIETYHSRDRFPYTIVNHMDDGRHLSGLVEHEIQAWIEQWEVVIDLIADMGSRIDDLSGPDRSAELHAKAAAAHPAFMQPGQLISIPRRSTAA